MEQNLQKGQTPFDGKLNDELRMHLRNKRLQMGLPYERLAEVFGVDWSTIRKWECGPTKRCSIPMRQKLMDFLNGKYDKELSEENDDNSSTYANELPGEVLHCMERIRTTYQLLHYRPDLRESLLGDIEKITTEMLQNMIDRKKN
ncbi:MAG: helix-turn-helix transcriptional regulator [Oligosphaeraceae bacterium]|nr:helix-turn-helix transcriptional regulator [Oligosphaeraceae bacterium]